MTTTLPQQPSFSDSSYSSDNDFDEFERDEFSPDFQNSVFVSAQGPGSKMVVQLMPKYFRETTDETHNPRIEAEPEDDDKTIS